MRTEPARTRPPPVEPNARTPAAGRATDSNPGAATPESLYRLYKARAATTANPFTLRNQFAPHAPQRALTMGAPARQQRPSPAPPMRRANSASTGGPVAAAQARASSPPRAGLRVLGAQRGGAGRTTDAPLTLRLSSLNVRR